MKTSPFPQREAALEERLRQAIGDCKLGRPVYAYDVVSSTMDVAHQLAAEGAPEGTLVWANRQEKGRGRLGRTWISPEGGLYCSFILRPTRPVNETPELSLVAGQAAAEAIKEVTGLSPTIKWPNDLLLNGKKVAGILAEARNGALVVGIGINVTTNPTDLMDTATSLAVQGVANPGVLQLAGACCQSLSKWYDVWTAKGVSPIRTVLA